MGQINLYKIDENKKDDFLNKLTEKFEFIGEQDYNSMENEKIVYTVGTYVNIPEERIFGFICKKICVYGKLFRNNMNGFYN
jgi:hypothetical protein